jgi:hypothetical protein
VLYLTITPNKAKIFLYLHFIPMRAGKLYINFIQKSNIET